MLAYGFGSTTLHQLYWRKMEYSFSKTLTIIGILLSLSLISLLVSRQYDDRNSILASINIDNHNYWSHEVIVEFFFLENCLILINCDFVLARAKTSTAREKPPGWGRPFFGNDYFYRKIAIQILVQADLYRTKAHIIRMQSARDIAQAQHDLNEVESLDSRLQVIWQWYIVCYYLDLIFCQQSISRTAESKRASFKADSARILVWEQ